MLGAETSTEAASSSDAGNTGDQSAAATTSDESASTTPPADFPPLDTASSTASSTEPVEDPPAVPYEEPFVLQPAVTLHVAGTSISADIELENLTCKACEKVLPAAQVKAHYTAWYPNDGEIKEVGDRIAEQAIEVSDVALWASRSMTWSAADIALAATTLSSLSIPMTRSVRIGCSGWSFPSRPREKGPRAGGAVKIGISRRCRSSRSGACAA